MQHQLSQHILFDDRDILSGIRGKTTDEKLTRLSVYKNNVFHSLAEAIKDIFPVTVKMLGEECFLALCYRYICNAPPSTPILSEYGQQFASFIAQQDEFADYPYLAELAKLEYQLLQLTNQKEEITLTPEDIAMKIDSLSTSLEESHWQLASYVSLPELPYRVGTLYQQISQEEHSNAPVDWSDKEWLLLCKNNLWGTFFIISYEEWLLLKKLQNDESFSAAIHHLSQEEWIPVFQSIIQKPLIISIW